MVLLVVLWSAFYVFLETIVGSYFLVAVVVQYVKVICYRVVRCDDALECTVSWEVLAYFRVDECVACCAEVCVRIVALIFCLFGRCFEGDRFAQDVCGEGSRSKEIVEAVG